MAKPTDTSNFLSPESFTSGLVDDVDMTITNAAVEEYDFGGKASHGNACAIHLTLSDDDGNDHEQYYPGGQTEHWLPTDDGKGFQPITGKAGINKNSAAARLINGMPGVPQSGFVGAGFPKNKLANDVSIFIGYKFHWKQISKGKEEGAEREKTILLPIKLVAAPGEKGAGKKAAGKPAAAAASGNGEVASDVAAKAVELTSKALEAAGEALTLDALSAAVFKLAVTDKKIDKTQRKSIVDLVQDTDWLTETSGPNTFVFDADAGTVESA